MLPNNELSPLTTKIPFLLPPKPSKIVDYEWGGVGLNDPSQGLQVEVWTAYYDGSSVKVASPSNPPINVITLPNILEVALAFDQNMRTTIAYNEGGIVKLRWYDSSIGGITTTTYSSDYLNPRLSLDDARNNQTGSSDIIFSYVRDNNLYMRVQRERFLIEHLLKTGNVNQLIQIGMTTGLRFQFEYQKVDESLP